MTRAQLRRRVVEFHDTAIDGGWVHSPERAIDALMDEIDAYADTVEQARQEVEDQ